MRAISNRHYSTPRIQFEIVRTPAGDLVVGFTDNSAKPPRNLLLGVGEDADGYKVLSADLENETAALEKDGVSFTLKMNSSARTPVAGVPGSPAGGVAQPAVSPGAATMSMAEFASRMAQHNPEATPRKTHGFAGANPPAPNAVSSVDRLRERRELLARQADEERARREQEAQARAQTTTTVEINNRLREANLNLIRKGLKPIGTIELTPEEDAKFVAEGVLPAR